ncbi:MAG TPA: nucleotide exchange factor GrpE [Phycisphaerales bacterium]|nr:nucleotide exchange factor GrpE [Phycisphaerales bacterium]|tara:strand:+ start:163 stop:750 length:588 start_codon:yes stop_codon:yes gene_type:complete
MNDKPTPNEEINPEQTPDEAAELNIDQPVDEAAEPVEELSEVDQLRLELDQTKQALADAEARVLRANADYQNMARRSIQNVNSARDEQIMSMGRELLTVMDQFDHALEIDPDKTDSAALLEGIQIVRDTLMRTFEGFGIKRLEVEPGTEFDPNVHEALMRQDADGIESNHVTMQLQPGYILKEKTLRPAKVAVAQ